MLRLHVRKHCWRHRFGDKAVDRHICPGQLSQELVEGRPDSTKDLAVSRAFALEEDNRNQERVSYMETLFLELICFSVTQYPPPLCVNMVRLVFSIGLFSAVGHLDNHWN